MGDERVLGVLGIADGAIGEGIGRAAAVIDLALALNEDCSAL